MFGLLAASTFVTGVAREHGTRRPGRTHDGYDHNEARPGHREGANRRVPVAHRPWHPHGFPLTHSWPGPRPAPRVAGPHCGVRHRRGGAALLARRADVEHSGGGWSGCPGIGAVIFGAYIYCRCGQPGYVVEQEFATVQDMVEALFA